MKAPGRGILEYVPGLAAIPVTMNLGMAPESWSEPGHSVPRRAQEGCGHEEAVIAAVALRQPLPDHEPDPVDHLVRPDPDQRAAPPRTAPGRARQGRRATGSDPP